MADKIDQAIQTMIQNLKEKTGKSVEFFITKNPTVNT